MYKVNAFGRIENGRYDPPSWKRKWIMMKITDCSNSQKICFNTKVQNVHE